MNPNNNPYFSSARPVQSNPYNHPAPYYNSAPQQGYTDSSNIQINIGIAPHNITYHPAPLPELNFAPSAHEVLPQSHPTGPVYTSYPTSYPVSNVQPSYPYPVNYSNTKPVYGGPYGGQNVVFQSAPANPYSHGFSSTENVVSSHPPQGGAGFPVRIEKDIVITGQKKKAFEYFGKRIENDLIKRTGLVGDLNGGVEEFDDYFETHIEKFFTPELHQLIFYHDARHIYGIQFEYRDPWGKNDKETYKGKLHMSKRVSPQSCTYSNFKLEFDEYLTELYVDGKEEITYFKFVTNEGREFQLGMVDPKKQLKNLVEPVTRIMGIGGSYDLYLNSVYFYYQ